MQYLTFLIMSCQTFYKILSYFSGLRFKKEQTEGEQATRNVNVSLNFQRRNWNYFASQLGFKGQALAIHH